MRDRLQLPEPIIKRNVRYEHDIHYTIQLCRWILKPIGIWHFIYGHASQNEKLISLALIVTCFSALCFVLIPLGLHTLFYEEDINIKVKLFGPIGFCLNSTIKYCYLVRGASFGKCIRHVENDWWTVQYQDHRRIMLKNAMVGRRLTMLCVIFFYIGGLSYHAILPLFSRQVTENVTQRPLTYPVYNHFFDSEVSPVYEIVFCTHCLFALITCNITIATCSLAAIFVTHACGQLQILIMLLDELVEGKRNNNTTVKQRLGNITRYHMRILKFSANVEEVLREICLVEIVASTLIICLLEYYFLTDWKNSNTTGILTYSILLITFTFNILIFCYIGELLVEQYSKIGSAVYNINWYDLSGNKAFDLVLIIMMSHYPPKLTAGKFFDLSIYTFSIVLKTSVIYLNLLRTVTE